MGLDVPDSLYDEWAAKGLVPSRTRPAQPESPVSYAEQLVCTPPAKTQPPRTVTPPRNGLEAIEVLLPIRVVTEANRRDHWAARARRFKDQGAILTATLNGLVVPELPVRVTWTKLGGRKADFDNLAGAFKGLTDLVAAYYGRDDGDESAFVWNYQQAPGGPHGVRLRLEHVPATGTPRP